MKPQEHGRITFRAVLLTPFASSCSSFNDSLQVKGTASVSLCHREEQKSKDRDAVTG